MKEKVTKLSRKLADRLKKEFDIDVEPIIHRTYAGHWQLSAGTWKWFMNYKNSSQTIGSGNTAKEVVNAKKISKTEQVYHSSPEINVEY